MITGRLPTVPEYYKEHINKGVDLTAEPKQCCPFHKEDTPSFSYNPATGRWSCFGRCHAHGDVIDMHMRWMHFDTKEEAKKDLEIRYDARITPNLRRLQSNEDVYVSEEKVEDEATYAEAVALANTPERWIELDYEMSKTPYDRVAIQILINKWKGIKSALE